MRVYPLLILLSCALTADSSLNAQPFPPGEVCPDRVAMFPAGATLGGPKTRATRFELHACNGLVQVLMFEAYASKAAMFLDTHDRWPSLLVHSRNVLVIQMIGGTSSPVYIFRFQNGKAVPPVMADTQGMTRAVVDEDGRKLEIDIPPAQTHKDTLHYSFTLEFIFPGSQVP